MSLAELELLALDPADPSNYDPIPDDEDDFLNTLLFNIFVRFSF